MKLLAECTWSLVYPLNFTYGVSANVNADAADGQNCGIDQWARPTERRSAEYKIFGGFVSAKLPVSKT